MAGFIADYALGQLDADKIVGALGDKFHFPDRLKKELCKHRFWVYKNVIKLMAPVLITWLLVQGVAAASGNHTSRWVDMLAVVLASVVFAVSWYIVMERRWKTLCLR